MLSGAFSGATLGARLALWLVEFGVPGGVAEAVGVGAVVTVITYASLIIGELVPKQIALRDPESVAVRVAPAMVLLAKVSSPLVWLLDHSGKAILWILGHRGERETRMVLVKATRCGGAQQVVIAHRPVGARRLGERLANRPLDLGRSDR